MRPIKWTRLPSAAYFRLEMDVLGSRISCVIRQPHLVPDVHVLANADRNGKHMAVGQINRLAVRTAVGDRDLYVIAAVSAMVVSGIAIHRLGDRSGGRDKKRRPRLHGYVGPDVLIVRIWRNPGAARPPGPIRYAGARQQILKGLDNESVLIRQDFIRPWR